MNASEKKVKYFKITKYSLYKRHVLDASTPWQSHKKYDDDTVDRPKLSGMVESILISKYLFNRFIFPFVY